MITEQYPIGPFQLPVVISEEDILVATEQLEKFPSKLSHLVANWDDLQLDTPYREGSWTARQLIHHIADSHAHSFIRYKWTLSEQTPLIKAYDQNGWASLSDAKMPIESSLNLIQAIHSKLVFIIRNLSTSDLEKAFIHPENNKERNLKENTLLYAWHSGHHYAHLENLAKRKGW